MNLGNLLRGAKKRQIEADLIKDRSDNMPVLTETEDATKSDGDTSVSTPDQESTDV